MLSLIYCLLLTAYLGQDMQFLLSEIGGYYAKHFGYAPSLGYAADRGVGGCRVEDFADTSQSRIAQVLAEGGKDGE